MFLELLGVPDAEATDAVECMCKAVAEGDASVWAPHQSAFLSTLIESFTANGLQMSGALADETMSWLSGRQHVARLAGSPAPAPPPWAEADLPAVHAWLAGKTPAEMSFSDWLMLGDYLVAVHAPPGFVQSHAGWLAVRASIMGRLEAQKPGLSVAQADNALASLPSTVAHALGAYRFNAAQIRAMEYAAAHCAEAITSATDGLRHGIKAALLQDMIEPRAPGAPGHALQTRLFDAFGKFNRDWRRIAVTEAGEAKNQGYIASLPAGARVRRIEQYAGACAFCRGLNGKEFDVVAPDAPDKNGKTQVWPGKSNIGRSASPNKVIDGSPVKRQPDELWWPSAGLQHPHCRGMWVLQKAVRAEQLDAQWDKWLAAVGVA